MAVEFMIGAIYQPPLLSTCQNFHADIPEKKYNSLSGSCHSIANSPLEFQIRAKEMLLHREVKNTISLKDISLTNEHIRQNDRFHSLGMAVTSVANIDIINNAYPHQNIRVDGQTEKSVNEICDNAPRGKSVDISKDNAINNRGKAFISGFLTHQSPLDATHYAVALNIGHNSKSGVIDPIMISQFTGLWQARSATSLPVNVR